MSNGTEKYTTAPAASTKVSPQYRPRPVWPKDMPIEWGGVSNPGWIPEDRREEWSQVMETQRKYYGSTSTGRVAFPQNKFLDDTMPVLENAATVGMLIFGGVQGIKSLKDLYNWALRPSAE